GLAGLPGPSSGRGAGGRAGAERSARRGGYTGPPESLVRPADAPPAATLHPPAARVSWRKGSISGLTKERHVAKGAGKARKKLPKELAVVRADNCTGCEACIEVCPVDCIYKVPGEDQPSLQSFVDIDLERCIGCSLCERWCPWDAIDMVDATTIAVHVADKGGPPEYVERNGPRPVAVAPSLANLPPDPPRAK